VMAADADYTVCNFKLTESTILIVTNENF
jgi:hypothetical protein